jgi:drug/metabolite transporter (DMT)-like permease
MDQDQRWIAPLLFVASSVMAGGNAVGVRFSNRELDPMWGATLRFVLAAALMVGVMAILRLPLPRGRVFVGAALYGLVGFGGAFALAFYALVEIEAGFGQVILSIVPLLTLFLAIAHRQEKATRSGIVGGVVALTGVIVLSGLSLDGPPPVLAVLAAIGAAICFSEAAIIVRSFPTMHPVTLNAVEMAVGAGFLGILAVAFGNNIELPTETATITALAYMVVIGSGLTFTLYVMLLRYWTASRANYTFVLIPVFTIALGAWLLDESINPAFLVGGGLVLLGVYIGALRPHGSR